MDDIYMRGACIIAKGSDKRGTLPELVKEGHAEKPG